MNNPIQNDEPVNSTSAHFEQPAEDESQVLAWEEVEAGRFMPRRVRGSCIGRALG